MPQRDSCESLFVCLEPLELKRSIKYKLSNKTPQRREAGSHLTCEGVNDEAEDHGDHRDEDPVREPLVLQAAVDGDGRLVTLEQPQRRQIQ